MHIKSLIIEEILRKGFKQYEINDELGRALIQVGNDPIKRALILWGADSFDSLKEWEKREVLKIAKEFDYDEISLLDWHSKQEGNGFGRMVIQKIFDLAIKYKTDRFTIALSSFKAREILNHYVEKGVLEPIKGSERGSSLNEYPIQFKLLKKP